MAAGPAQLEFKYWARRVPLLPALLRAARPAVHVPGAVPAGVHPAAHPEFKGKAAARGAGAAEPAAGAGGRGRGGERARAARAAAAAAERAGVRRPDMKSEHEESAFFYVIFLYFFSEKRPQV